MQQKALQHYSLVLATFLTILLFTSYGEKQQPDPLAEGMATDPVSGQVIRAIDLDRPFDFAGEAVPMENFDVRERLDRELIINMYRHSTTVLNIKNAYKYFPTIEKILKEQGLPEDFKYLAVAESDLRNAVSPAGAKGIWQFVGNTAEYYGLEINSEVDERYHLEKATVAACKYLLDYKKKFGSWTLAAAAYNMGGPRLGRELESQQVDSYYDLNLNEETSRYVFRLVAIKEIIKDPKQFGFYLEEKDGYPPMDNYRIVEVNGPVNSWIQFAKDQGTTYRLLKWYNPWLTGSKLTNAQKKTYQIKVPKGR